MMHFPFLFPNIFTISGHFICLLQVFILQVEGHNKWQLHKPPIHLPRDYSKDLDQSILGKPTHDITLMVKISEIGEDVI